MKLRYTVPALADLNSILDYISAHSPQGATADIQPSDFQHNSSLAKSYHF